VSFTYLINAYPLVKRLAALTVALLVSYGLTVCRSTLAQPAASEPKFEVASVRRGVPPKAGEAVGLWRGGPGTSSPTRVTGRLVTLRQVLRIAYDLRPFQIAGPGWLDSERYDIDVLVPLGATIEEYWRMLRGLLAERFRVKLHHDVKDFPFYDLVLNLNKDEFEARNSTHGRATTDVGIRPSKDEAKGTAMTIPMAGGFQMTGKNMSMVALARVLETRLNGAAVVDRTGVAGTYDFTLEFSNGLLPQEVSLFPSIFTALRDQLGLRLVTQKGPFDVVIIDQADRVPMQN
jgi:uncharacterized protein (TIGR03435 family)